MDLQRTAWVDRKFNFDAPPGWIYNVCERLSNTEHRLKHIVTQYSDDLLSFKPSGKWSIKEHIGHLLDLEILHIHRLHQLQDRVSDLTGADMSNKKTELASHNSTPGLKLVDAFAVERNKFLNKLDEFTEEDHAFKSLHPRLKVFMRPVDLATFCAEHDEHHLASISEIIRGF